MRLKRWVLLCGLSIGSSVGGQTTEPATSSMLRLPEGADRVVIPLETAANFLVAKVQLDGHEGWFLVDTGASWTVVGKDTAEQWKLQPTGPGQSAGVAVPVQVYRAHRLSCGKAQYAPLVVEGLELREISSALQFRVAGILGDDLLGQGPFEIDYRKRTLTVYDPSRFSPPAGANEIPVRLDGNRPWVEISIEGYRVRVLLDTGGMGSGMLSPAFFAEHPSLVEGKSAWSSPIFSLKGMSDDFNCEFNSVSVLGRAPHAVTFSCSREYDSKDNIETVTNAIGAGELQDSCCTFDYVGRRMWVKWLPKETTDEMLSRLGDAHGHDLAGVTPLMRAVEPGRSAVLTNLQRRGADVNSQNAGGQTALMRAAQLGNPEAVQILLGHGARVEFGANLGGDTALHYACQQFNLEPVRELLKAGADPNALDTHGWTPLKRAAEGNQLEIVQALLAAEADPLIEDKQGLTPLLVAARQASPALLGAMLDKLGKRAASQSGGALVMAAWYGRLETVKSLLDRGADPNYVNVSGATPLIASAQDPSGAVAALLLSRGANPAFRSKEGKTAWDYASAANQLAVLRALREPPAMPADQR
jgi:ankyrin repeat protein